MADRIVICAMPGGGEITTTAAFCELDGGTIVAYVNPKTPVGAFAARGPNDDRQFCCALPDGSVGVGTLAQARAHQATAVAPAPANVKVSEKVALS